MNYHNYESDPNSQRLGGNCLVCGSDYSNPCHGSEPMSRPDDMVMNGLVNKMPRSEREECDRKFGVTPPAMSKRYTIEWVDKNHWAPGMPRIMDSENKLFAICDDIDAADIILLALNQHQAGSNGNLAINSIKEVMLGHRDPDSSNYNECEKAGEECMWCVDAEKAISELTDQAGSTYATELESSLDRMQKMYSELAKKTAPQAGSISTVTETEIIRACNLAGLPYTDWQKIRAYLPVFAPTEAQSLEDKT